ncbi:hypothetical protein [Puerhibacterium sp. TATVAM-FAB25]|uniref:hypothetical protein n=1 Tax=Puerhibacterium sp. TATVAM-FAB25 TaxID=3093699 RepID=UPI00397C6757
MGHLVRWVRGLLVGSTALSLAVGAHVLAGDGLPTTGIALAALVATVLPAAVWLTRGPLSLPRVLPVAAALQVALHIELSVLAHGGHAAAGVHTGAPHAGHAAHLDPAALQALLQQQAALAGPAAHDLVPSAPMLAAHAVAVLVTCVVLATGDRAAAWLLTWLSAVALLVRAAVQPLPGARRRGVVVDPLQPRRTLDRLGAGGLRFRGPPLRLPAARAARAAHVVRAGLAAAC